MILSKAVFSSVSRRRSVDEERLAVVAMYISKMREHKSPLRLDSSPSR